MIFDLGIVIRVLTLSLISCGGEHEENAPKDDNSENYITFINSINIPYPQVNLNRLIGYFHHSLHNCLLFLDLFEHTQFSPLEFPILLRPFKNYWEIILKNDSISSEQIWWFPLEQIVDSTGLVLNSKPWNCQVHLSLFPPAGFLEDPFYVHYLIVLKRQPMKTYMDKILPPPRSSFNILIKNDNIERYSTHVLHNWMSLDLPSLFPLETSKISNNIFMVADTTIHYPSWYGWHKRAYEIISIHVLCASCQVTPANKFLLSDSLRISDIMSSAYPTENENALWAVSSNIEGVTWWEKLTMFYLTTCEPIPKLSWGSYPFPSPSHQVAHAYASVWISLMKNYTIVNDVGDVCINGRKFANGFTSSDDDKREVSSIKLDVYLYLNETLFDFPLIIHDKLNRLKFVSCGYRVDIMTHDAYQFVAIFDKLSWILILLSFLVFAVVVKIRLSSNTDGIVIFLKLLLEQNEPFCEKLTRIGRWRYPIALFLLVGILLSNSYKITNIYNVIAPRVPPPYENLLELTKDNFTVYSRSEVPMIFYYGSDNELTELEKGLLGPKEILKLDDYLALLMSELTSQILILLATLKIANINKLLAGSSQKLEKLTESGIINGTQLHPTVLSLVTAQNFEIEAEKSSFMKRQNDVIFDSLKKCDQVAAILPEYLASGFFPNLEKNNPTRVSLGKEVYSVTDLVFILEGDVPRHIIRSLKNLRTSGIWERWMDLVAGAGIKVGHDDETGSGSNDFEKTTMAGNIVLIFFFLILGYGFSFISFAFETGWYTIKNFSLCIRRVS